MPSSSLHTPSSTSGDVDTASSSDRPDDEGDHLDTPNGSTAAPTEADESSSAGTDDSNGDLDSERTWRRMSPPRLALLIGLVMAVALAGLTGVLGVRAYHARQSAELRARYLQAGRQGALNLTTIDWHHVDTDVQRVKDAATGPFYDDFSQRAQPFIDVVQKVQSISTGTVSVAGLESATDSEAQVLVAVSVQTTTTEAPQRTPHAWRMRISLQKVGNDVKVSNVEFVP